MGSRTLYGLYGAYVLSENIRPEQFGMGLYPGMPATGGGRAAATLPFCVESVSAVAAVPQILFKSQRPGRRRKTKPTPLADTTAELGTHNTTMANLAWWGLRISVIGTVRMMVVLVAIVGVGDGGEGGGGIRAATRRTCARSAPPPSHPLPPGQGRTGSVPGSGPPPREAGRWCRTSAPTAPRRLRPGSWGGGRGASLVFGRGGHRHGVDR